MDCHGFLIFDCGAERVNRLFIFLLNSKNSFVSSGDVHTVFYTAHDLVALLFDLSNVMVQSRLTLCRIDQNVSMIQMRVKLDTCRESGSSHSNNSGRLHHLKRCTLRNLLILVRLFLVWPDYNPVFLNLFYHTVYTGENIRSKSGWFCYKCTFFYQVSGLHYRLTWCSYVLTQ